MKPTLSAEIEASSSDEQSTGSQASGNVDGSKLVSTVSKKQQAVSGWNDIVDKVVSTFEPDLPTSSACVLLVSVAIMMANEAAHFVSRATDGVDGLEFQNTMAILVWVNLIARNLWIIRHLKNTHPVEMRAGFRAASLVYHSLFGNASSLILKLVSYGAIGYFFKMFAFASEGHCDLNPLVDAGRLVRTQEMCEESVARGAWAEVTIANESRGFCIGDLTTLDQDECETMVQIGEWRKNKTLTSTWVLFFLQAINYPILWLTLTAVENSFLQVKFIALMIQLTMVTFLASSLAFHLLYIANKNFNPAFASMRILSLGAFIAMRLEGYTFAAFKRDEPTKAFCLEMREDVRGMRFLQETQREELKQGYMNNRKMFGASRSGPNEADLVGSPV